MPRTCPRPGWLFSLRRDDARLHSPAFDCSGRGKKRPPSWSHNERLFVQILWYGRVLQAAHEVFHMYATRRISK